MPFKDRNKANEYERNRKLRYAEEGYCEDCGTKLTKENYKRVGHCKECCDKAYKIRNDRAKRLKDSGLCTICGKNPLSTGYRCDVCDYKKNKHDRKMDKLKRGTYIDDEVKEYLKQFEV